MAKKRISLSEIKKADELEVVHEKKPVIQAAPKTEVVRAEKVDKKVSLLMKDEPSPSVRIDTAKMSVVVPLHIFETLQDISRRRRREKQPFKLSDMVREALHQWLEQQR